MTTLRLGTRGSQLALYQARITAALLKQHAGVDCDTVVIRTSGDRLAEAPLSEIGGKRLFVKEIEDALLADTIDLAVHSSKDMPVVLPDGLEIGAVLARDDPRDALVLPALSAVEGPASGDDASTQNVASGFPPPRARARDGEARRGDPPKRIAQSALASRVAERPDLGEGGSRQDLEAVVARLGREPRIGTSSVRRSAQLTRLFPGARFLPIRGNLDTRLRKLDAGEYDAIVLAAAGLRRLESASRISATLPADVCVPAPGQGIIALEVRADDDRTRGFVERIDDRDAAAALAAERAVVRRLGGGCQMPIGAYAEHRGHDLELTGVVMSLDGAQAVRASASGPSREAEELGAIVAEQLLAQGAAEILSAIERAHAAVEGLQP